MNNIDIKQIVRRAITKGEIVDIYKPSKVYKVITEENINPNIAVEEIYLDSSNNLEHISNKISLAIKETHIFKQHNYIINFYGSCIDGNCVYIVYEFMTNGNIIWCMNNRLSWNNRIKIISQFISALLHICNTQYYTNYYIRISDILIDTKYDSKVLYCRVLDFLHNKTDYNYAGKLPLIESMGIVMLQLLSNLRSVDEVNSILKNYITNSKLDVDGVKRKFQIIIHNKFRGLDRPKEEDIDRIISIATSCIKDGSSEHIKRETALTERTATSISCIEDGSFEHAEREIALTERTTTSTSCIEDGLFEHVEREIALRIAKALKDVENIIYKGSTSNHDYMYNNDCGLIPAQIKSVLEDFIHKCDTPESQERQAISELVLNDKYKDALTVCAAKKPSEDMSLDDLVSMGLSCLYVGRHEDAIEIFNHIAQLINNLDLDLELESINDKVILYSSICLLHLNRYDEACIKISTVKSRHFDYKLCAMACTFYGNQHNLTILNEGFTKFLDAFFRNSNFVLDKHFPYLFTPNLNYYIGNKLYNEYDKYDMAICFFNAVLKAQPWNNECAKLIAICKKRTNEFKCCCIIS